MTLLIKNDPYPQPRTGEGEGVITLKKIEMEVHVPLGIR